MIDATTITIVICCDKSKNLYIVITIVVMDRNLKHNNTYRNEKHEMK